MTGGPYGERIQLVDASAIGALAAVVSVLITLLALLSRRMFLFGKWIFGLFRRTDTFLEDFNGAPARPGFPARPGVMERLQTIEYDVGEMKKELNYNSGSTLKDAVHRIDLNVKEIAGKPHDSK